MSKWTYFPRTETKNHARDSGKLVSQDARRSGKDLNEDPWEAEKKRIRHCPAMAAFRQRDWDFYEQVVPRNKSYCKRSPWAATCESISRPVQGGLACKFGENHERKGSLALPVASPHSLHLVPPSSRFFSSGSPSLPPSRLHEHKEDSFRLVIMSPRGCLLHPFILELVLAEI